MTRVVKIQNMEAAESLRPILVALWAVDGKPSEMKVDPQRELTLAIHEGAPMISIGMQPVSETDLPSETVIKTAQSASELQNKLDAALAENQQFRADKDALATEVERLTKAAAEHKPAEDSELSAQLSQALADNKVLAEAYEKRFEELKAAEGKSADLDRQLSEMKALNPPKPADEGKPLDKMTKAELLDLAKDIEGVTDAMTKAEIIAAIDAATKA